MLKLGMIKSQKKQRRRPVTFEMEKRDIYTYDIYKDPSSAANNLT